METLAREAKQRASDPLSVVQFWACTFGGWGVLGMKLPEPMTDDPGIALVISGMAVLAKRLKEQAKRFGRYLKAYGRADVELSCFCKVPHVSAEHGPFERIGTPTH